MLTGTKHCGGFRRISLNLTWLNYRDCSTLLLMQKRSVQRGRPPGTTRYEAEPALAFGKAVRAFRMDQGVAQEELAAQAGIERSHMSKIERGKHLPSLTVILKVAVALKMSGTELMAAMERNLHADAEAG